MRICFLGFFIGALACLFGTFANAQTMAPKFDDNGTGKFAQLALGCVHKEYPNKIAHVMASDADVKPPRELYPAFYGCFDWHSSVHGHWLLARYAHIYSKSPLSENAISALEKSITKENILAETQYLNTAGRASFERPYGLAWALQLGAELREWGKGNPRAKVLAQNFEPLERAAAQKLKAWLPNLRYPVRSGEHSQTAFGLGLALDWARTAGDKELEALIVSRARFYYLNDKNCPISYEPSGEDFLSPCLAEAALMARVLPTEEFSRWLSGFMPTIPKNGKTDWLPVGIVTDRADPKLAHIDGLNISRAWMLNIISNRLGVFDRRTASLENTAKAHADATLPHVTGEHYEGGHWLGSFAIYYLTNVGIIEWIVHTHRILRD